MCHLSTAITCVMREAGSSCVAMTTLSFSTTSCCWEVVLKQTSRCSPWSMTFSRSRLSSLRAASCSAISSSVCVTSFGNCVSSSLPHSCRRRVATSLAVPESSSSAYRVQTRIFNAYWQNVFCFIGRPFIADHGRTVFYKKSDTSYSWLHQERTLFRRLL